MLDPDFYEDDAPRIIAAAREAGRRAAEANIRLTLENLFRYPRGSVGKKIIDESMKTCHRNEGVIW